MRLTTAEARLDAIVPQLQDAKADLVKAKAAFKNMRQVLHRIRVQALRNTTGSFVDFLSDMVQDIKDSLGAYE